MSIVYSPISVVKEREMTSRTAKMDRQFTLDRVKPERGDALLIIDPQNDFFPKGGLPVPCGDQIIPVLNQLIALFEIAGLPVFVTRDWHPANHCSFTTQGGKWPVHCIADSFGAAFPDVLTLPASAEIINKASNPGRDAYSGFDGTDLDKKLQKLSIHHLYIGGLATDYCVLDTVLDARRIGYDVTVFNAAIRGVEANQGDVLKALEMMQQHGAVIV